MPAPELFISVTFSFFFFLQDFITTEVCTKSYSIYTIKSFLVADEVYGGAPELQSMTTSSEADRGV